MDSLNETGELTRLCNLWGDVHSCVPDSAN